jgi:hypothetical protein
LSLGNSNKALADFVESIFETNIIPNNPLRVQRIEGDRLMRLPSKAFKRWLQISQASSSNPVTAPQPSAELPRYQFKVSEEFPVSFDDEGDEDHDTSYLVEEECVSDRERR